jgi:hypothetical protein
MQKFDHNYQSYSSANLRPIIRPGNFLIQLVRGGYYIGNSRKGFCFDEIERFRFLQYCNGKRDLLEISKIIGTEITTLTNFLSAGVSSRYLLNLNSPENLPVTEVGTFGLVSKADSLNSKTRRNCEFDFYLRYEFSNQWQLSAAELFTARASQEILLFGSNQFTVQLLATLQSTGFSRSRIIGSFGKDHGQIIADDISGGIIQSSDIGSTLSQISKRIIREQQLVNTGNIQTSNKTQPALIIGSLPIPADYQQRWLSESTPHLVIGSVIENQIDIGPIIIPGRTACLRCLDLTATANALSPEIATLNYLTSTDRFPAAVLNVLVGYVALFVTEFLDQDRGSKDSMHPLISSALRINLTNLCKQTHIKWQPNSMCGCGADLAQYANGAKG